ncbi:XRE family transcriptional regulator [Luteolibacter algae]|uniref:XRE family transcriptional regulator n=1 Tax=Luteolibacter algae TaxID=454151 RepID=A0ABW5D909_9BACT
MEKKLNTPKLQEAADSKGLNQTAIATELDVTRASVSKWLNGKSFPRPAELLKLGRLLGLKYADMVALSASRDEPLVAFRKRASCQTTDLHLERARNMGHFLKPLVEYLDVDPFMGPASLKNPSCDYGYLQDLAARIRRELDIAEKAPFDFKDLIDLFHKHQAVIIPTLWGHKTKHENALHIHLPESQTTWIYLNLDVEIHDFKFWMAHELGHVLTVDLLREKKNEEAEDFADAFAGALLFPEPLAKRCFEDYKRERTDQGRLKVLGKWAKDHVISPFSVYKETEKFAESNGSPFTAIDGVSLHSYIAIFNKQFKTLGTALFDGKEPTADQFMRVVQDCFDTQVYSALSRYVRDKEPGSGTIATILGVNPMDARAYLEAFSI